MSDTTLVKLCRGLIANTKLQTGITPMDAVREKRPGWQEFIGALAAADTGNMEDSQRMLLQGVAEHAKAVGERPVSAMLHAIEQQMAYMTSNLDMTVHNPPM